MGEDIHSFIAGWLGGCGGLIASHPLDTIKIRMQSRGELQKTYSKGFTSLFEILRKEKVRGLFKGMTYPLLGQASINATVFGVQDYVYRRLSVDESSLSSRVVANGLSGMVAGGVQCLIVCPMELIKIRMQKQGEGQQHVSWMMKKMKMNGKGMATGAPFMEHYQGPLKKTVLIYREQGVFKGLFRGWWLTLFREVPQFGIYFSTFTFLKGKTAEYRHKSEDSLGVVELSLAGGITGVITWLWYPMDVIKTLYQADGAPGEQPKYKGVMNCCVQNYKDKGWKIFWRGFGPTAVRGFFNSAATFPIVTLILRFLRQKEE